MFLSKDSVKKIKAFLYAAYRGLTSGVKIHID